ncbi:hypothetical protein Pcinc_027446 [Petrolisthes cinctipes]|uniref:Uncharacterized protein n=1 Tax=Petrolisthes cinctipes TaxID=88211 RepID=A0AAE1F561_PETCI|nr:hypothetical protein Pcinc_027446 [Petrolisthes cinctipes]
MEKEQQDGLVRRVNERGKDGKRRRKEGRTGMEKEQQDGMVRRVNERGKGGKRRMKEGQGWRRNSRIGWVGQVTSSQCSVESQEKMWVDVGVREEWVEEAIECGLYEGDVGVREKWVEEFGCRELLNVGYMREMWCEGEVGGGVGCRELLNVGYMREKWV